LAKNMLLMNVFGSIIDVSVFLSPGRICIWEKDDVSKKPSKVR
jgi:hypothetical protein